MRPAITAARPAAEHPEVVMFDETELAYLRSQPLGRLATVDGSGQPDNAPVGFEFDGERFWIGGRDVPATHKYQNVAGGHEKVAFTVDDLASVDPWRPRGIRVFAVARAVERDGRPHLELTPTITWSWGLAGASGPGPKRTVWR